MSGLGAKKAEQDIESGSSFGNGQEKIGEEGDPDLPGTRESILLCVVC